jgi:hypothetical protein
MSINIAKPNEFVEYPSKIKLMGLSFMSLVFGVIGGAFLAFGHSEEEGNIKMVVVGIFSMIFFGFGFIYFLYRLMNRQPSIIMNKEGIIDNSSYFGAGRLKWTEIQDIKLHRFKGQKFIGLELHDTDQFLARQSGLKKYVMRMNKGLVQSPVNISQSGISMPLEQLYVLMLETWQNA